MNQIYPQQWISLPKAVRHHLVKVFELERTGASEIFNQEERSDGFVVDDLKKITQEKMNEYIGSEETFWRAWEITLAKVHSELYPPVAIIQTKDGEGTIVDIDDNHIPPEEKKLPINEKPKDETKNTKSK